LKIVFDVITTFYHNKKLPALTGGQVNKLKEILLKTHLFI